MLEADQGEGAFEIVSPIFDLLLTQEETEI
jgi:hypothetical protein